MLRRSIIVCFFIYCHFSKGQIDNRLIATSMHGISTTSTNPMNPASLSIDDSLSLRIDHLIHPNINALDKHIFSIGIKTSRKTIGISFQNFGSRYFQENQLSFILKQSLSPKLKIGIKPNIIITSIEGYTNSYFITPTFGLKYSIDEKWQYGIIFQPKTIYQNNTLSTFQTTLFGTGLCYQEDLYILSIEAVSSPHNFSLNIGLEYILNDIVYLRFGSSPFNKKTSTGFGILFNKSQFDFSITKTPYLGLQIGLGYQQQF